MKERKIKKKIKRTALLLLSVLVSTTIGIGVFCCANSARAADSDLVITEIMYDQSEKIDDEKTQWVEMVAKRNIAFELRADNQIKSFYLCARKNKASEACTFYAVYSPEGINNVSAGSYVIFTVNPDLIRSTYSLPSDIIILKTSSSFSLLDKDSSSNYPFISYSQDNKATLHEEIFYGNYFDKKEPGYSLERIDFDKENIEDNWQESYTLGGTPGSLSSTAPPMPPSIIYSKNIKISELLPNPSGNEDTDEFMELYNTDPEEIVELSGWTLEDKSGNSYSLPDISINPGEYIAFYRNNSAFSLNNTGGETVTLKNPKGDPVGSSVSYSGNAKENYSYALDKGNFVWTSTPTPDGANVITTSNSDEDTGDTNPGENYLSAENVYLNEILPNPKKDSDDEYIEIVNGDSGPVDLRGWMIRDASKSGKYVFKEHTEIGPGEYLAIYKSESKIALNNSKESVYLHNPRGEITSSASYEKSQKDASFNFDSKNWKWSKYLTPGKKNKFDSEPSVKIKKIKQTYKDIYTEFSAKAKDKETKKLKFSWDFGDGKRSSLQKTSHKYLDTGKYTVTLSVSDDSQTVEKSFALAVKKYPQPDLEIMKIIPNPIGNDSNGEIIDIKNGSGKKIDLRGWKIASGSDDKIYNHPISGEISLGPNETKTITREICKFSLNNKVGKVQLVSLDGKIIDEVEYQKEKIAEGEAYAKTDGGWQWISPSEEKATEKEKSSDEKDSSETNKEKNNSDDSEVLGATNENVSYRAPSQTRYTPEDKFIFFKIFGLLEYQPHEANFCPAIQPANTLAYF
ncbi:MAG: lamin tail domain-containing protein [Candidatus Moranbacteria bacterium]|nr:lamin tail domain-containing protein [Candidatus Moranbacteria bacterium]